MILPVNIQLLQFKGKKNHKGKLTLSPSLTQRFCSKWNSEFSLNPWKTMICSGFKLLIQVGKDNFCPAVSAHVSQWHQWEPSAYLGKDLHSCLSQVFPMFNIYRRLRKLEAWCFLYLMHIVTSPSIMQLLSEIQPRYLTDEFLKQWIPQVSYGLAEVVRIRYCNFTILYAVECAL